MRTTVVQLGNTFQSCQKSSITGTQYKSFTANLWRNDKGFNTQKLSTALDSRWIVLMTISIR